jgi:hypothetical protein
VVRTSGPPDLAAAPLLEEALVSGLTEGTKHDAGKLPLDLLSPYAAIATAEVLLFGAQKYERWNWSKGILYSRVYSALLRHLTAWWTGEELDPETNLPHLAHASCCLMFLLHFDLDRDQYAAYDDRPDFRRLAA